MALRRLSIHLAVAGALAWKTTDRNKIDPFSSSTVIIRVSGNHKIQNLIWKVVLKCLKSSLWAHRGVQRLTCVSRVLIWQSETLITPNKLYGAIILVSHVLQMFSRTLQRRFVVKLQKRRADNESHHFLKVKPPSNFHIYSFSRHNSEKLLRSRLCKMVLFSFLPPSIWIRATAAVSLPMFVLHHVVWSVHCLTVYLLEYKTLLF